MSQERGYDTLAEILGQAADKGFPVDVVLGALLRAYAAGAQTMIQTLHLALIEAFRY